MKALLMSILLLWIMNSVHAQEAAIHTPAEEVPHVVNSERKVVDLLTFSSLIDDETQGNYIVEIEADGMVTIRYSFEEAEEETLYRSYLIGPGNEWVFTSNEHAGSVLEIRSDDSQYWLVPLSDPQAFTPLMHGHVEYYCDYDRDLFVAIQFGSKIIRMNCSYQVYVKDAPVAMGKIEVGQKGEKIVVGNVLVIKAKGIRVDF